MRWCYPSREFEEAYKEEKGRITGGVRLAHAALRAHERPETRSSHRGPPWLAGRQTPLPGGGLKIPMAWTVAFLHAMGQPESRRRNVSKETSRSDQVVDEKGPFLRFLYLFAR